MAGILSVVIIKIKGAIMELKEKNNVRDFTKREGTPSPITGEYLNNNGEKKSLLDQPGSWWASRFMGIDINNTYISNYVREKKVLNDELIDDPKKIRLVRKYIEKSKDMKKEQHKINISTELRRPSPQLKRFFEARKKEMQNKNNVLKG